MTRVAAVDCGTNSIRLLIADLDPAAGTLADVTRRMEVVRLGQGVDRTGMLAPEALARTFAATADFAHACEAAGVERLRFVATSATRDAGNREEFVAGILERLGVEPEVVSGEEEARLSFAGATGSLAARHPGPYCVVDIGGGSTELVVGAADVVGAFSADVGCVRMTERHLASDPPTAEEIERASADIDATLDAAAAAIPLGDTRTLVGLAGSVTTVTAHALELPSYQPDRIHGSVVPLATARRAASDLITMTRAERAALPYMHPGRVDVIGAGALIWRCVMDRVAAEVGEQGREIASVVTSEHDILDGIAWSLADPA